MKKGNMVGGVAFFVGLVLAVIFAVVGATGNSSWVFFVMALIGLIVGLLNVADKEVVPFLVASLAFLISFQALSDVITALALGWGAVSAFFSLMRVFIAPAAAVVALKALYNITRD